MGFHAWECHILSSVISSFKMLMQLLLVSICHPFWFPHLQFTRWPWLSLSVLKLVPACLWQIYWSSFFNSSTLPSPLSLTGTRGFEIPSLAFSPADIFLQTAWIKDIQWDTWCSSQGAFRLVAWAPCCTTRAARILKIHSARLFIPGAGDIPPHQTQHGDDWQD